MKAAPSEAAPGFTIFWCAIAGNAIIGSAIDGCAINGCAQLWVAQYQERDNYGGVATELVTAKMEEGATLDAVAMPRSLTVNIFGDGGDAGT